MTNMIPELVPILSMLALRLRLEILQPTLDLLESLSMQPSDGVVLLFETRYTARQG